MIRIQAGNTSIEKQRIACVVYADDRGYAVAGVIRPTGDSRDAVNMIRRGDADIVVVAFGGQDLAEAVIEAGGRIEAVHPRPHVVEPPPAPQSRARPVPRAVLDGLRRAGKSAHEIAVFLGDTTEEIRRRIGGN